MPRPVRRHSAAPHSIPAERLLKTLSFTHFVELLEIDDPFKRAFYETQAIRRTVAGERAAPVTPRRREFDPAFRDSRLEPRM